MAGTYCKPWCIYCRRAPGLDCTDAARPTKWRRQIEKNGLRRYVTTELEDEMGEEPYSPFGRDERTVQITEEDARKLMGDTWEPAGGHAMWEGKQREQARALAEEHGYDATIRPWNGGWEISGITGPGVEKGATQACLVDEVEYMIRDYVSCVLGLEGEENDEWEPDAIPVRLTLDLEPQHHMGTRIVHTEVHDRASAQRVMLVEEVTWWTESPEAE